MVDFKHIRFSWCKTDSRVSENNLKQINFLKILQWHLETELIPAAKLFWLLGMPWNSMRIQTTESGRILFLLHAGPGRNVDCQNFPNFTAHVVQCGFVYRHVTDTILQIFLVLFIRLLHGTLKHENAVWRTLILIKRYNTPDCSYIDSYRWPLLDRVIRKYIFTAAIGETKLISLRVTTSRQGLRRDQSDERFFVWLS